MSTLLLLLCAPNVAAYDEVIVDDEDGSPSFTTTGDDWTTWDHLSSGFDGGDTEYHYLTHTKGGSDRRGTATWTPTLPVEGTYRIETWFRATENRSADADHYIYDGDGYSTHVVVNQVGGGEGSGWLDLGEYYCRAGEGGCVVTLDGTDDDESDEANAMRFTVLEAGEPEPEEEEDCSDDPGPGTHEVTFYPVSASGSGGSDDWSSVSDATGAPDGREASTPNVDAGEYLKTTGWDVCEPAGARIDRVVISVLGRLQYDSGQYALVMNFDGGGAAGTTWSYTSANWTYLDITTDRGSWSFGDLSAVQAEVTLSDHPGGARDSDAWVDAFAMTVTYTIDDTGGDDGGGDDGGAGDTGDGGGVDSEFGGVDTGDGGSGPGGGPGGAGPGGDPGPGPGDGGLVDTAYVSDGGEAKGCGCSAGGAGGAGGLAWAGGLLILGLLRRGERAALTASR